MHDTTALPGLIALNHGVPVGLLLYRVEEDECELVVLVSERRREGVATALVDALSDRLRESGCTRAWLVTTNDNSGAQSFYESLGWRLAAVHRGAVTRARELKPEIPAFGEDGIPIEDEIEYELDVSVPDPGVNPTTPGTAKLGREAHARVAGYAQERWTQLRGRPRDIEQQRSARGPD